MHDLFLINISINLFDTYRENLKDVDTGGVQLLLLAVRREGDGYVTEVL